MYKPPSGARPRAIASLKDTGGAAPRVLTK
jgi:hypothetical protein